MQTMGDNNLFTIKKEVEEAKLAIYSFCAQFIDTIS